MEDNGRLPDIDPSDFQETPEYKSAPEGQSPEPAQSQGPEQREEPQQATEMLKSLSDKGYDVSHYSNDEEFIEDTETKYAAALQQQQQKMAEEYSKGTQWAEQPQGPDPNLQAPANQPRQGELPEFDQSWVDLVENDGNGRYVVKPEYIGSVDPTVADRVNRYVNFRQDRSNSLIDDPVNTVLEAGLGSMIQEQINNTVNQALSQTSVKSQAREFVRSNEKVLYLHDTAGQPKRTQKGEPILSPVGQALNQAHVQLRQQGMNEPNARHQVAMQMVQNHFTQQQLAGQQQAPVQQQAPMQPNEDYKQQYTDQPFSEPTNPYPAGYMPNTPVQPNANAMGPGGLPEHNSLGSLATALAVHKGYLQPK